jgi:CubicO group peptidase (beta-lactamase class C family)
LYSKIAGYDSVAQDASPLREDAVFKVASCTKLITSIAMLQCVEQGLVALDEPITRILPELDGKDILKGESGTDLIYEPSTAPITARQLLTHTSGLTYRVMNPLVVKWAESPNGQRTKDSNLVVEKHDIPLVFEPGTGWIYGTGLDWAGVAVRRLHGGISLEDYFIENVWKKVGLSAPFPTFALSKHPGYKARLMQGAQRGPDGKLKPFEFALGDNLEDQGGGEGLVLSVKDYTAVLADLISDSPRLLKAETISMMFTPQLTRDSTGLTMLRESRHVWNIIAAPVSEDNINHGLAGLLILGDVAETGQRGTVLVWGGVTCPVWFASRELGVAGFFATQMAPYGDPEVVKLISAWKKDFWTNLNKTAA